MTIAQKAAAAGGPFPFAAIALVAASTAAISKVLRNAAGYQQRSRGGGGSSGAGSSGGSSSFAFAQDSAPIRLVSDVQIRGQDLYVVFTNYEKNNRNTRNG